MGDLVAPNHRTCLGLRKREAKTEVLPNLSDLTVQHVSDAKRLANAHRVRVRIQREACATGGDAEALEAAQFNDQLLGQSLGKEALFLVAVRDSKRHDRHRRRTLPRVA